MASFSVEDFVGNGVLKELVQKLLEDGWDDVPTLKVMSSEDMAAINMTQRQKVRFILSFSFVCSNSVIYWPLRLIITSKIMNLCFSYSRMQWKLDHTCMIVLSCSMEIS